MGQLDLREGNDAASDVAPEHVFESVVNLLQLEPLGNQLVELQPALPVEFNVSGACRYEIDWTPCCFLVIFRSLRNEGPSSSIFVPSGIIPIMVAVPPALNIWNDCSAVSFLPMASKE